MEKTFVEISTKHEQMSGGLQLTPEQTAVIVEAMAILEPLLPEDFTLVLDGIPVVPES